MDLAHFGDCWTKETNVMFWRQGGLGLYLVILLTCKGSCTLVSFLAFLSFFWGGGGGVKERQKAVAIRKDISSILGFQVRKLQSCRIQLPGNEDQHHQRYLFCLYVAFNLTSPPPCWKLGRPWCRGFRIPSWRPWRQVNAAKIFKGLMIVFTDLFEQVKF